MNKVSNFTQTIKGRTTLLIFSFLAVMLAFSIYVFLQADHIRKDYQDYKLRWHPLQLNIFIDAMSVNAYQTNVFKALSMDESKLKEFLASELSGEESRKANSKVRVQLTYTNYLDTLGFRKDFEKEILIAEANQISMLEAQFKIFHRVNDLVLNGEYNHIRTDSLISREYLPEFEKSVGIFWNGYFGRFVGGFNENAESAAYSLNERIKRLVAIVVVISIVLAVVYTLLWNFFIKSLGKSIEKPVSLLNQLSQGELPNEVATTKDELSAIIISSNKLSENLRNASNFTVEIGKGNFVHDFKPLSEKDVLGNALIAMKNDLESYSLKEKQLNWANVGTAKFAEILRNTDRELTELCDELIKEVVKYLKANQGGVYIYNETSKNLNLVSCYAYERKKFVHREIEIGEGLLGQCFLEADRIYLTQIPENYVTINSGLGGASPRSLLLVPIKSNQQVVGVVELASFREFQEFEMAFLEKICENIASMISTIMRNNLTQKLLKETTFASESLRAQEEEMRQNLEELHATQEEMQRKERQYLDEIANLKQKLAINI